jgi:hypothetical protein
MEGRSIELIFTKSTVRPQFIYCCRFNELRRANLLTGEQSCHKMPTYRFRTTVVGVSCLEEAYSSLEEEGMLE